MKLMDLLRDKLMGVYTELYRSDGTPVTAIYQGMRGKEFVVETHEELQEGESVQLRIAIGGWNLVFPCKVNGCRSGECVLSPSGEVKIKEKRKEKRIPCVVSCEVGGNFGTVLDVSHHGVRVLTLGDFNLGVDVELRIGERELVGSVKWIKREEVDLKSVGLFLEDPPRWWEDMVKSYLVKYVEALRRL